MERRFFIALGSNRYQHLPAAEQLEFVQTDKQAAARLFGGFGYEPALPGLGEYDGADQIRQKLRHWATDVALTSDDIVVLYFAGHGVTAPSDRHYLFCWDSSPEDLAATALATEDLVRILCNGDLRHLLLVLDTCAGGSGSAEATALALQRLAYGTPSGSASSGLWFLASARRKDIAGDGKFTAALTEAVAVTTGRTGQRQQYLDLTELVKAVNERFDADGRAQRAELASGLVTGLAPFLPNVDYHPELPPLGTDLEIQRRVAGRDLAEHFGPRSRGVEFESEQGLYFSGRAGVLSELVAWLGGEDDDGRGRIVTGSPGCGKSAVLGRIVALSDEGYRTALDLSGVDPATVVPVGLVAAAVHARHKRLEEVVERIGDALGIQADGSASLLQELSRRGRQGPPLVIVVDALDEAGSDTAADAGGHGEPRRISRELLRPMAEIHGVRLLVGTRHELIASLGPTFTTLDLDLPGYRASEEDVAGYVARVLAASEEPEVRTPYRDDPALTWTVACGVAAKAAGVYLYARTTARTLRSDRTAVDASRPGWADALPSEVGGAFDDYLARFGADEQRVRRMLLALAFSEGKGLPRGRVWTELSSVLSGVSCTEEDVTWVLDVAEAYIAEVTDDDRRSAYRLYHKALAEHLRATAGRFAADIQRSVGEALTALVPGGADNHLDWLAAPPYVRMHLSTHAAAAGTLDVLMEDPGFLLAAEPLALLGAFTSVGGQGSARRIRGAYEQVAHRLTAERPLGERAADLQLSARRCGADELADRIDGLQLAMPWSATWAWWSASGVHRLLSGHTKSVECTAVGELDGRPVAVTGSQDGTALLWDLVSQRQIGRPMAVDVAVSAIEISELDDYTLVLTGGEDGTIRVWDLSVGQEYGEPLTGHTNRVESIVTGRITDTDVALTTSADGTARLWDLHTRRQLGRSLAAHRRTVNDADLGELDGRPVAVTGGEDQAVYLWDLSDVPGGGDARIDGLPLLGTPGNITALRVAEVNGRAVALVGDSSGMLSRWDLADRRQIGEPVLAHLSRVGSEVKSVATGRFQGREVALTSGLYDVRLWDLTTLQQIGRPLRGHVENITAAALKVRDTDSMAVTVSDDRTARVWDLTTEQPEEEHVGGINALACTTLGGRMVAVTASEDGTARCWDLVDRRQVGPAMEGHTGSVRAAALWVRDGRAFAATGGADTAVRLWDATAGTPVGPVLNGHTNAVTCVAAAELQGRPVVVSGSEDGTVRVWDGATGEPIGAPLAGHIGGVKALALHQDGPELRIVLATSSRHCYVRNADGAVTAHLFLDDFSQSARPVSVAFRQGRPLVVCAAEGYNVHILDVTTAGRVAGPFCGHTSSVSGATLGRIAGREVLATTSWDSTVRLWNMQTADPYAEPLEERHDFNSVTPVFGRIGTMEVLVTSGRSGSVRIWNLEDLQPWGEPLCGAERGTERTLMVRTASGHDVVAAEGRDGGLRLHDLRDGRPVGNPLTGTSYSSLGIATAEVHGRVLLLRGAPSAIEVWELDERRRLMSHSPGTEAPTLGAIRGRWAAAAATHEPYDIHAWEPTTGAALCPVMKGHTGQVRALRFWVPEEGEPCLVSASMDGTLRLWDLTTGLSTATFAGHEMGASSLELIHHNRDLAVCGTGGGRVRLWDLAKAGPVALEPEPFASPVTALAAIPMGDQAALVAGDRYGQLRVWDLRSPSWNLALDIGSGINDIAADETGRVCVATDMGLAALSLRLTHLRRS
ncbi:caspase family protein [Streptomyces sp. NPDC057718]|uniref:caspase family protein n=1 Tax=Streptomyces sp. NPDC057718 TaxID=3346225 RepID=UPI0036AAF46F